MGTVLVCIVLAVIVFFAIRSIWKSHKKGECAGGCAGCSQAGTCPAHQHHDAAGSKQKD